MLIVNKLDKSGKPLNELAKNGNSVNKIYRNGEVVFQKLKNEEEEAPSFSKTPLTFNITSDGTINWKAIKDSPKTIEYKLNNGGWISITSNTTGVKINVNAGDKIQFRGDNATYGNHGSYSAFGGSTAGFEVEGNIMSLINPTDFDTLITLQSDYTFCKLFAECRGLTSAENLVLPATTLADYCYQSMFWFCSSLTTAPAILPASEAISGCYWFMFAGCGSLTSAPAILATTLNSYSCPSMFSYCAKLNYIKCLATNILSSSTGGWVNGVASTGTFVKSPDMNDWTTGKDGIPEGWTIIDA